jgi:4-hydroxybenzoate polyprenyltransferase
MRPHQWLSNLVVFAPLVFSENLTNLELLVQVAIGFLLLCGLSSATFLVNDVVDHERDRSHPVRQRRPLSTGDLTAQQAIVAAVVLSMVSLAGAFALQVAFGLAATAYLAIMLAYPFVLRHIAVVDALAIAIGLVLRAAAGAILIEVTISPWLYLSVGGLGLILALGRIQYEMRLAEASGTLDVGKYTPEAVDSMFDLTVACTLIVYCLYTFLAGGVSPNYLMMLTIPFALYGIFRYRYLVDKRGEEHSPERLMLTDPPMVIAVLLWALTAVIALYVGGAG